MRLPSQLTAVMRTMGSRGAASGSSVRCWVSWHTCRLSSGSSHRPPPTRTWWAVGRARN